MVPGSALRPGRPQTRPDAALVRCRVTSHGLSLRLEPRWRGIRRLTALPGWERGRRRGRSQESAGWPVRSATGSAAASAWPGWPMKSSSAWLTSSAWVQMIACGPPAMTVERALLQQRGKPLAGGLVGQDAILVAVDDQDGDADRGEVAPEVFQAGCDAAEGGVGRGGDGDVEAVLPRLVADPAAAQEIDVVGVVQEVFHRGRPVGGDPRRDGRRKRSGQCRQDCRAS